MRASELERIIKDHLETGFIDTDTEVEFMHEGYGINEGSFIGNVLVVIDGDSNKKLLLTNFEKVIE